MIMSDFFPALLTFITGLLGFAGMLVTSFVILSLLEFPYKLFRIVSEKRKVKQRATKKPQRSKPSPTQTLPSVDVDALAFLPEVCTAFRKTNNMFHLAAARDITMEENHFLEQVVTDYYPHIYASLRKVSPHAADDSQRKIVVSESLKQLRLIRIELSRIISRSTLAVVSDSRAQTEFLANKLNGGLSISQETINEEDNDTPCVPTRDSSPQGVKGADEPKLGWSLFSAAHRLQPISQASRMHAAANPAPQGFSISAPMTFHPQNH